MVHAYYRGHPVVFDEDAWVWRYEDTREPAEPNHERPCPKCHKMATPEGYDACIGFVPGYKSICCGHGVTEPIWVTDDGDKERGCDVCA